MSNYHKTELANGLRVITVPLTENQTVTVLVLVETGSKYETKQHQGISHFIEHMCFKGTSNRPSALAIAHELDSIGAQSNAFTSQEYTGYYAKSDASNFSKIFDVISDIYLHSTFPASEIEKEKGVVIEEIHMYEDSPQDHVQDLFMALMYGDTPAGWNIAGTVESVRGLTRDDLVRYYGEQYVPEATTVIVAGNFNEDEVRTQIEKVFGEQPRTSKKKKDKVLELQKEPAVSLTHKATDQTHFVLGFRAFDTYNIKNRTARVLATILGQGMSSRLFQKLREEMGVCYYVRTGLDTYTDHGIFMISVGCDTSRVEEVVSTIIAECKQCTQERVLDTELQKAKQFLIGNMKLGLESSDEFASFYGAQDILHKEIKTLPQIEEEIRAVTAEQIKDIAGEIFQSSHANLALIGPYTDKDSIIALLKL